MADQATIEDGVDTTSQTTRSQGVGSSGGQLRTIIPNETKVNGVPIVYGLGDDNFEPNSKEALTIHPDSIVSIHVGYPGVYDEVFLRYGNNAVYKVIRHNNGAYVNFNFNESSGLIGSLNDGEIVWVELRSKDRPDLSGLISYYLTFQQETSQEQKAREEREQAEKEKENQDGQKSAGDPTSLILDAGLDAMGGIASALGSGGSAGAKTMSRSGTGSLSSSITRNIPTQPTASAAQASYSDYGGEASTEFTGQEQATVSSTTEVSGGTQTISQGGTVGQSGTVNVSSGGTVSASQGSTVSGTVVGGASVVGSAAVSGTTISSVSGGGTVTARVREPQAGSAGGGTPTVVKVSGDIEGSVQSKSPAQPQVGDTEINTQGQVSGTINSNNAVAGRAGGNGTIRSTVSQGGTAALGLNLGVSSTPVGGRPQAQNQQPREASSAQPQPAQQVGRAGQNIPAGQATPQSTSADKQQAPTIPKISNLQSPKPSAPPLTAPAAAPLPGKGNVDGVVGSKDDEADKDKEPAIAAPVGAQAMLGRMLENEKNLGGKLNSPILPSKEQPGALSSGADAPRVSNIGGGLINGGAARTEPSADKESDQQQQEQESPVQDRRPGTSGQNQAAGSSGNKNYQDGGIQPGQKEQDEENSAPVVPNPADAPGRNQNKLGKAAGIVAKQNLLGKVSNRLWKIGFGTSAAVGFSGLDFFAGAVMMDIYWFAHKKQPELFPMKPWQKVMTVMAHLLPFVYAAILVIFVLAVGCNYPVTGGGGAKANYRLSVVGAIIGSDCEPFDLTNVIAATPSH